MLSISNPDLADLESIDDMTHYISLYFSCTFRVHENVFF